MPWYKDGGRKVAECAGDLSKRIYLFYVLWETAPYGYFREVPDVNGVMAENH